jgi:hypothetical protein
VLSPYRSPDGQTFEQGTVTLTAKELLVEGRPYPREGLVRVAVARRKFRRLRFATLGGLAAAIGGACLGAWWLGPTVVGATLLGAGVYLARTRRHGLILTWASGDRLAIFCSSVAEANRISEALEIAPAPAAAPQRPPAGPATRRPEPRRLAEVTGVSGGEVELIQEKFAQIDRRTEGAEIVERLDAKKERADLANALRQAEDNRRRGR